MDNALILATLASGSTGNCALVSCGETHILLDAGISAKQISAGVRALGADPMDLSAVFITHEHADHVAGLRVLTNKVGAPIYATPLTCRVLCRKCTSLESAVREQAAGSSVQIGTIRVQSFSTPHDAADSVGYIVEAAGQRLVLCTDLGHTTNQVLRAVEGCDLLVCEANHDEDWVRTGPYPYYLKQRILGDRGHLSNEAGAELALHAVETGARTVVLAHLSRQNNDPDRAYGVVCRRLQEAGIDPERDIRLLVAPAAEAGPLLHLERKGAVC